MNVTLFRDLAQERWASIDVYGDRLADGLRKLSAPGWDYRSLAPRGWVSARWPTPSLYLNRVAVYMPYAFTHASALNHVLDNSYGHLLYALDAQHTIVTSHGGTPRSWRRWNREGPAMQFFDWTFKGTLRAARIVIVSDYSRRELLQDYDYDPARIRVVHHGIDERFAPVAEAVRVQTRARHTAPDERGLILHVGHCAARKNVEAALRAFAELLRQSSAPYRFLQIGGEWSPAQSALIAELGIGARVTQIAQAPNRDLPAFYNAADLFVFPSLYEGFGIPLIEAMACGAPVVCNDYELFHEVCGDAAGYADCTDPRALATAMARALNQTEVAAVLRERGLARARQFTWQQCAEQTLAVYQGLADELA
ncbi:MAG: glycosyltransferase family 4 protein [Chloroflexi bacterium]|nr:glycosyltransferase family 4 protein [Chloroflexota bacterium]